MRYLGVLATKAHVANVAFWGHVWSFEKSGTKHTRAGMELRWLHTIYLGLRTYLIRRADEVGQSKCLMTWVKTIRPDEFLQLGFLICIAKFADSCCTTACKLIWTSLKFLNGLICLSMESLSLLRKEVVWTNRQEANNSAEKRQEGASSSLPKLQVMCYLSHDSCLQLSRTMKAILISWW